MIFQANRGMFLEEIINRSITHYKNQQIALLFKRPVDIQIKSVEKEQDKVLTKGYIKTKSTTDYYGIYKGKYVDFEAKECASITSFPLNNLKTHQMAHLNDVISFGCAAFVIIFFTKLNQYYLLKWEEIKYFIENANRASIPIEYIKEKGYAMEVTYPGVLDFLSFV